MKLENTVMKMLLIFANSMPTRPAMPGDEAVVADGLLTRLAVSRTLDLAGF